MALSLYGRPGRWCCLHLGLYRVCAPFGHSLYDFRVYHSRHGASNTARAYTKLSKGKAWKWVGYLEVLTGFLITGYYAVVSGWCLQYVYASIMGELHGDPTFVAEYFKEFSADPIRPVMWTVVIFLICHFVIIHGVRGGIEKASKIMMPVLFILLLIIVVAACLLPNAGKGVEFLLKPDFSKVDNGVFLGALGQSFYSLSIGMGCICTYASYFSRQTNLFKTALQISVIDFMVAILAGLMIFPAAFSVGVSPDMARRSSSSPCPMCLMRLLPQYLSWAGLSRCCFMFFCPWRLLHRSCHSMRSTPLSSMRS